MGALRRFIRRYSMWLSLSVLIALFTFVLLSEKIFITIPAGHAGVLWERFKDGTVEKTTYPEGFHIILPWNEMYIYNVRLNEATSTANVLAKDGLKIEVEFLTRYRPLEAEIGYLHKHMGEKYLDILILPEVNAKARSIMADYSPEEIYSTQRSKIQERIESEVKQELNVTLNQKLGGKDLIFVEDVLIKSIHLPQTVRLAIEAKVEHKHRMLQYEYILKREEQESKRKAIEAQGIRQFQDTIKDGISDRYLRWKGIDATLELARSNNAKIVVIGAGKEGMPLILGNMDGATSPTDPQTTDLKTPADKAQEKTKGEPGINTFSPNNASTAPEDKTFTQKVLENTSLQELIGTEKTNEPKSGTTPTNKEKTK